MDHPIPSEDVVQVLEDDEYITIKESQKKNLVNYNTYYHIISLSLTSILEK